MSKNKKDKKRGPKGGIKHQPGRGHDRKSKRAKKKRFSDKSQKMRRERQQQAIAQWKAYDELPDEVKKLMGPAGEPKLPRPEND